MPSDRLEWHGHNDFHKVHVNGATAWLYGCDAAERHAVRLRRADRQPAAGRRASWSTSRSRAICAASTPTVITELAEYMQSIGFPIPDNYPFVGQALQHHAGRHPRRRTAPGRADLQHHGHRQAAESPAPRGDHRQERRRRHRPLGQRVLRSQGRRSDQQDQGPQGRPLGHGPVREARPPDRDQRRGTRAARRKS